MHRVIAATPETYFCVVHATLICLSPPAGWIVKADVQRSTTEGARGVACREGLPVHLCTARSFSSTPLPCACLDCFRQMPLLCALDCSTISLLHPWVFMISGSGSPQTDSLDGVTKWQPPQLSHGVHMRYIGRALPAAYNTLNCPPFFATFMAAPAAAFSVWRFPRNLDVSKEIERFQANWMFSRKLEAPMESSAAAF